MRSLQVSICGIFALGIYFFGKSCHDVIFLIGGIGKYNFGAFSL